MVISILRFDTFIYSAKQLIFCILISWKKTFFLIPVYSTHPPIWHYFPWKKSAYYTWGKTVPVPLIIRPPGTCELASNNLPTPKRLTNNSSTQKINYFKVGEYLEAVRYSLLPHYLIQRNNLICRVATWLAEYSTIHIKMHPLFISLMKNVFVLTFTPPPHFKTFLNLKHLGNNKTRSRNSCSQYLIQLLNSSL